MNGLLSEATATEITAATLVSTTLLTIDMSVVIRPQWVSEISNYDKVHECHWYSQPNILPDTKADANETHGTHIKIMLIWHLAT